MPVAPLVVTFKQSPDIANHEGKKGGEGEIAPIEHHCSNAITLVRLENSKE